MEAKAVIIIYYVMGLLIVVGLTIFVHFVHRQVAREKLKAKLLEDEAREFKEVNQVLGELHRSDRKVISLLKSRDNGY